MKKFHEELEGLTTPNIRSVLRWLNNNVEKTTKPVELASMKHDKCLKIIEDKYKPHDIEKALAEYANGKTKTDTPKPEKEKPTATKKSEETKHPETPKEDLSMTERLQKFVTGLQEELETLDTVIKNLKEAAHEPKPASYIVEISVAGTKFWFVIAASANGACVIDEPFVSMEKAAAEWPEAILPGPLSKPGGIEDML